MSVPAKKQRKRWDIAEGPEAALTGPPSWIIAGPRHAALANCTEVKPSGALWCSDVHAGQHRAPLPKRQPRKTDQTGHLPQKHANQANIRARHTGTKAVNEGSKRPKPDRLASAISTTLCLLQEKLAAAGTKCPMPPGVTSASDQSLDHLYLRRQALAASAVHVLQELQDCNSTLQQLRRVAIVAASAASKPCIAVIDEFLAVVNPLADVDPSLEPRNDPPGSPGYDNLSLPPDAAPDLHGDCSPESTDAGDDNTSDLTSIDNGWHMFQYNDLFEDDAAEAAKKLGKHQPAMVVVHCSPPRGSDSGDDTDDDGGDDNNDQILRGSPPSGSHSPSPARKCRAGGPLGVHAHTHSAKRWGLKRDQQQVPAVRGDSSTAGSAGPRWRTGQEPQEGRGKGEGKGERILTVAQLRQEFYIEVQHWFCCYLVPWLQGATPTKGGSGSGARGQMRVVLNSVVRTLDWARCRRVYASTLTRRDLEGALATLESDLHGAIARWGLCMYRLPLG